MSKDETMRFKTKNVVKHGGGGGLWFLGFIGTFAYFLHVHSGSFWLVTLAFVKALLWPAFVVFHLLLFMHV